MKLNRWPRSTLRFIFLALPWLVATSLRAADAPKRIEPLSPEQSLTRIRVPAGYRVELVAAEPMIEEPVMCAWDADGRMYVAEMRGYMQDTAGTGRDERNGRVKRLEDTDGDGRMDKATVFADGLLLPRIIIRETTASSSARRTTPPLSAFATPTTMVVPMSVSSSARAPTRTTPSSTRTVR